LLEDYPEDGEPGCVMGFKESDPTLHCQLEYWAAIQPDAPFIVELDENRMITYAQFREAVLDLRRMLGNRQRSIALALPGGIPAAIVWIAALTGGHCLIPCAPESTPAERALLGERHVPDVVVVASRESATDFGCLDAQVITSRELYSFLDSFPSQFTDHRHVREQLPYVPGSVRLSTSGTTGEPKGVLLSEAQIAWTAEQVHISHRLAPGDRGLCVLPFFHINAPVVSLCGSLMAGSTLVIAPRFSLHRFWDWVVGEQVTWASVVPTIVALLLTGEQPAVVPETLRFVRTASAPLPVSRHLEFEDRFGVPIVETYGLSEAASQVTANPVPPVRGKVGSVGLPTGVELRVCEPLYDGDGAGISSLAFTILQDVPPGEEGEICVRGPSVISHYEGRQGGSSFAGGWFRTGDLGYRDQDGFVYITGRLRDVINRGGEKVSPREIEEVLLAHPTVRDAAVTSEPDSLYGQRIVAYIVSSADRAHESEEPLRAYCRDRLSAYKIPETFYFLPALPRNGNGKLARKSLEPVLSRSTSPNDERSAGVPSMGHGAMAHG
jgi:acyl-CoA synthetase (AMP-forming)/AMP-acid ligase II